LSGCSAEVAKSNDRLIFGENILNLAVIEGSSIESNCLVPIDPKTTSFLGCVIFPLESEGLEGKDWDSDYSQALSYDGWVWIGGEANVSFFEKPTDGPCNHQLLMIGWFQGTQEQQDAYMQSGSLDGIENSLFAFSVQNELVCDQDHRATQP
jgi:hypothetical protein